MATYTYQITIYAIDKDGPQDARKLGEATGEVEADRYSHACIKAWSLIHEHCDRLREATGERTGVGDLHVERKWQPPVSHGSHTCL